MRGAAVSYHNLGPPSYQCRNWHASMWYEERTNKAKRVVNPTFFLCCQDSKVLLSKFNDTPPPLNTLLDYNDPATSRFRDQIRVYNNMFCFISFGANVDHSFNAGMRLYTFRINGQNYHRIGSLLHAKGTQPRYAQLYFFDTQNKVRNQMATFVDKETSDKIALRYALNDDVIQDVNNEIRLSVGEPLSGGLRGKEDQLSAKHQLAVKGLSEGKA
ncbi:hypothetical protein Tco_0724538 [Tanacetum coccineum]